MIWFILALVFSAYFIGRRDFPPIILVWLITIVLSLFAPVIFPDKSDYHTEILVDLKDYKFHLEIEKDLRDTNKVVVNNFHNNNTDTVSPQAYFYVKKGIKVDKDINIKNKMRIVQIMPEFKCTLWGVNLMDMITNSGLVIECSSDMLHKFEPKEELITIKK